MTKIVYNACYGGFGLSDEAITRYFNRKGKEYYPENKTLFSIIWTIPEDHPDRVFYAKNEKNSCRDPDVISRMNKIYKNHVFCDSDVDRTDPDLVAVVEELGSERASSSCAKLAIEELSPGTLYRITKYDGLESVETQHDIDWRVA